MLNIIINNKGKVAMPKKGEFRTGLTLVELMIAAGVLVMVSLGLIMTFIGCFTLNEGARNLSIAMNACQEKMEEIRSYAIDNFDEVYTTYDGAAFEVDEATGLLNSASQGVVEVSNANPELLEIVVTVCWRQKAGRMFGEDADLDGVLDAGEDDGDGQLESPAQLITLIARR